MEGPVGTRPPTLPSRKGLRMSSTKLIKTKGTHTREGLAELLEALADSIRAGEVTFEQGAEQTVLELPADIGVTVEVKDSTKRERRRRKLEVEIRWELDEQGAPIDAPPVEIVTAAE